jgi:hypothetical protein
MKKSFKYSIKNANKTEKEKVNVKNVKPYKLMKILT